MGSKQWYCYNKSCRDGDGNRTVLGSIVSGELQLNRSFAQANTDGASLVVICPECGRPNTWWPKDSDLVEATFRTHAFSALLRELARMQVQVVHEVMEERGMTADSVAEKTADKLYERVET